MHGVISVKVQDVLSDVDYALAVGVNANGVNRLSKSLHNRSKFRAEDALRFRLQWLEDVPWVPWRDVNCPPCARKDVVIAIEQGAIDKNSDMALTVDRDPHCIFVVINEMGVRWRRVKVVIIIVVFSGGMIADGSRVISANAASQPSGIHDNFS